MLISVAVTLAGCASLPLPRLAPPIPVQWRHASPATVAKVDLQGWWLAFHDPQLNTLVATALHDNLNVAAAHERLLAARALEQVSTAPYRPIVRASTVDAIDPDASASFLVAGFDAAWELPLFGRGTASRRQAEGNRNAARADLQQVRVSLVGEVVRDWLQLRTAQQQEAARKDIVRLQQRQLDLLRIRKHLELAAPDDVERAEASLAQAVAASAEPAQSINASAQSLATLLGRPEPDVAWLDAGVLPDLEALELTSTPADLLRTRPEIARAQADVLSAAGDAGIARADRFPSIGIGGSIVWSTNVTTHRRTNDNAIASAGPLLNIPLFDWGLRQAQAHAKEHQLKAAVFAYRQAVLDGVAEVETALGRLQQQRTQERQTTLAATALGHVDAAITKRAHLGLASPLDQIDSALAAKHAELACIDARVARGLAFVSLFKALGGAPMPDAAKPSFTTRDWH